MRKIQSDDISLALKVNIMLILTVLTHGVAYQFCELCLGFFLSENAIIAPGKE